MIVYSLWQAGSSLVDWFDRDKRYKSARGMTKSEKAYKAKLTKLSKTGDPEIENIRRKAIHPIMSAGAEAESKAIGGITSQGLYDSIITTDIKQKINQDTLKQVAESSRKIAEYNRKFKIQKGEELDQFNMNRDAYLRNLSASKPTNLELIGDLSQIGANYVKGQIGGDDLQKLPSGWTYIYNANNEPIGFSDPSGVTTKW